MSVNGSKFQGMSSSVRKPRFSFVIDEDIVLAEETVNICRDYETTQAGQWELTRDRSCTQTCGLSLSLSLFLTHRTAHISELHLDHQKTQQRNMHKEIYSYTTEGKLKLWRMASSGMLYRVAFVRTDVSEELSAFFIRLTRIGELETTLVVTINRRMQSNIFCVVRSGCLYHRRRNSS
jgi:hypothetical protein